MRLLSAVIAALPIAAAFGPGAAKAADGAFGRVEARARASAEEPGWRRVEIDGAQVDERAVMRRRVTQEAPSSWRRVQLHEDRLPGGHGGYDRPAAAGFAPGW